MLRNPDYYLGGVRARDGGAFLVGDEKWPRNPRHVVPRAYVHVARLWHRCRSGMGGFAALPEAGGINQQPSWLMAAFSVLETAEHQLDEAEKRRAT